MKKIKKNLPEIKQNINKLKSVNNEYFSALSAHDVNLNSSIKGFYSIPNEEDKNNKTIYTRNLESDLTISTTLPSGTNLSLGGKYTQSNTQGENKNEQLDSIQKINTSTYDPIIKLGINQPLLYNFFGFLDRSAKKNAKMKIRIEAIRMKLQEEEILHFYRKLYFSWIQYKKIIEYINTTIQNIDLQIKLTREKITAGIEEKDVLLELLNTKSSYQENFETTKQQLEEVENKLELFINLNNIKPDKSVYQAYLNKSITRQYSFISFEKTLTARKINLSRKKAEYSKKLAINELLPELNLFANLDIKFHKNKQTIEKETTTNQSYGRPDITAGLEFKYSIGNYKKRSNFREVKLQISDLVYEYEKLKNQHTIELNNIISNITSYKAIVKLKENQITTLKKIHEIKQDKFKKGLIDFSILVNNLNQIAQEEIQLINLKTSLIHLNINYNKIINS